MTKHVKNLFKKSGAAHGDRAPKSGKPDLAGDFRLSCRHTTFREEADEICDSKTLGEFRRAMMRNGWAETGNGKGGHIQYAKPGINDKVTLVSRNHDNEKLHRYIPEQMRELYARAFPDQFPKDLVDRAYAKAHGQRENYVVPAARLPLNQVKKA